MSTSAGSGWRRSINRRRKSFSNTSQSLSVAAIVIVELMQAGALANIAAGALDAFLPPSVTAGVLACPP